MLIVRDTRESGEMLEAALAAGRLRRPEGTRCSAACCPRPGAALLVRRYGFDLAAVVSASHNPYEDNGIKFFGPEGTKLADAQEDEIERLVHEHRPSDAIGRVRDLHGAAGDYVRELESRFAGPRPLRAPDPARLRQRRHLQGRAGDLPAARRRPRARGGGSRRHATSTATAAPRTSRGWRSGCVEGGFDIGFAFDGDGDRVLAVDRDGAVVDGDELMALAALHLREQRPAARRRRGGHGDDQLRLPPRHGGGRDRGGHHAGRGSPRARRAAEPRLGVRRRAVRPHHRHGLRARGRRHRGRAAHARGARRARPRRARRHGEAARSGS